MSSRSLKMSDALQVQHTHVINLHCCTFTLTFRPTKQAQSEYKHVIADISRSPQCCHVHRLPIRAALSCHSNETRAPIANPPVHRGQPLPFPKLHPGPCSIVGMRPRTDSQTDIPTRMTTIHFASSTTHAKPLYIKRGKVSVCTYIRKGGRGQLSSE